MITISRATHEDIPRLVPLFGSYREFYRATPNASAEQTFLEERLAHDESVIFVAEDNLGNAVGFTQLYPCFSSVSMEPIWILNDLYVDASARGTGAGRALLEHARDYAKQTGAIRLQLATEITNEHAQAVYNACGWERDTTFYHYSLTV